jgi:hypothetical protein
MRRVQKAWNDEEGVRKVQGGHEKAPTFTGSLM